MSGPGSWACWCWRSRIIGFALIVRSESAARHIRVGRRLGHHPVRAPVRQGRTVDLVPSALKFPFRHRGPWYRPGPALTGAQLSCPVTPDSDLRGPSWVEGWSSAGTSVLVAFGAFAVAQIGLMIPITPWRSGHGGCGDDRDPDRPRVDSGPRPQPTSYGGLPRSSRRSSSESSPSSTWRPQGRPRPGGAAMPPATSGPGRLQPDTPGSAECTPWTLLFPVSWATWYRLCQWS